MEEREVHLYRPILLTVTASKSVDAGAAKVAIIVIFTCGSWLSPETDIATCLLRCLYIVFPIHCKLYNVRLAHTVLRNLAMRLTILSENFIKAGGGAAFNMRNR